MLLTLMQAALDGAAGLERLHPARAFAPQPQSNPLRLQRKIRGVVVHAVHAPRHRSSGGSALHQGEMRELARGVL